MDGLKLEHQKAQVAAGKVFADKQAVLEVLKDYSYNFSRVK